MLYAIGVVLCVIISLVLALGCRVSIDQPLIGRGTDLMWLIREISWLSLHRIGCTDLLLYDKLSNVNKQSNNPANSWKFLFPLFAFYTLSRLTWTRLDNPGS